MMEEIKLFNPATILALVIISLLLIVLILQLVIFNNAMSTRRTCKYCGAVHTKKSNWLREYWDSDIDNKKISETLELINKVKNGEKVKIKKYSLHF